MPSNPPSETDAPAASFIARWSKSGAAEEASGVVRWLRPEYQCKNAAPVQAEIEQAGFRVQSSGGNSAEVSSLNPTPNLDPRSLTPAAKPRVAVWPKALPSQAYRGVGFRSRHRLLRDLLVAAPEPMTAEEISRFYTRVKVEKVEELLKTLVMMGQAREIDGGGYGK